MRGEPAVLDPAASGAIRGKETAGLSRKALEKRVGKVPRQLELPAVVEEMLAKQRVSESDRETGRSWRERSRIPRLAGLRPRDAGRG